LGVLDKITYMINKRGLTDTQFQELLGLGFGTVSSWRSGKTKSYMRYLSNIAEVLNVTEEYLLYDDSRTGVTEAEKKELAGLERLTQALNETIIENPDLEEVLLDYMDSSLKTFKKLKDI